MTRQQLLDALSAYSTPYDEERAFVTRFVALLRQQGAFQRNHLPGHMTGSAWIVDIDGKSVLLTHHAKLDRWLQPGGHADGDENILAVATREAAEETGLTGLTLRHDGLFDIDIHTIPARGDFPQHLHYDVRFAFTARASDPLTVTRESRALAWIPVAELAVRTAGNTSILRMAEKIKATLSRGDQ